MKILSSSVWCVLLTASVCQAQTQPRSPRVLIQQGHPTLEEYLDQMRRPITGLVQADALITGDFKIDAKGRPVCMKGRIIRILDANSALVSLQDTFTDRSTGKTPGYATVVLRMPTKDVADGMTWAGSQWSEMLNIDQLRVSGTIKMGTRTFFVLEKPKY